MIHAGVVLLHSDLDQKLLSFSNKLLIKIAAQMGSVKHFTNLSLHFHLILLGSESGFRSKKRPQIHTCSYSTFTQHVVP